MWTIKKMEEADFGCEERLPGEPLLILVYLENEDGDEIRLEVPDNWLEMQGLVEGDEWTEEIDMVDEQEKYDRQSQWWDNYMNALNEVE